jgi:protein-arginine deiminase
VAAWCVGAVAVPGPRLARAEAALEVLTDADGDGALTAADAAAGRAGRVALVLANRDDDDRDGRPDADDERVNGAADERDLVPLRIVVADPRVAAVAVSAGAAPVRFFQRDGAGWRHAGLGAAELPVGRAADAAAEVALAVEATAWAGMPPAWNGTATLAVRACDGTGREIDTATVACRVAPVLLAPSTARVAEVFVAAGRYDNAAFLADLERQLAGVPLRVFQTADWREMWMQDTMEIGEAAIPGSAMHVVLAGLRGADSFPPMLLGPDTAVAEPGLPRGLGGGDSWADWYGNLEVSMPLPAHPSGRVIHGKNLLTGATFHPDVVAFLAAQGVQDPVWIDTSWLLIKHVDEIVAFLPGADGRGAILVPDPEEGLRLADPAAAADPAGRRRAEANRRIARIIDTMLSGGPGGPRAGGTAAAVGGAAIAGDGGANPGLLALLGWDASRVVRLPVAFDVPESGLLADGGVTGASAVWSDPVNALVVNGTVICGSAGMPQRVREICRERFLAAGAERVEFIDDGVYQKNHGNVHCATNARRMSSGQATPQPPPGR